MFILKFYFGSISVCILIVFYKQNKYSYIAVDSNICIYITAKVCNCVT